MVTAVTAKSERRANQLYLTPRTAPLTTSFLNDAPFVFDLIDALGSPLNVLLPQALKANVEQFGETFTKNGVIGRVFFAHKCNRSDSLTWQLSNENCSID